MPPRRRGGFGGGTHLLDRTVTVYDWAPPGWHWEVLPSGRRSLVRILGPAHDPDLLWWHSLGPRQFQREQAPREVILRRIREEDEHVRRYVVWLETSYSETWSFIQRDPYHVSFSPVRVPYLWMVSARGQPGNRRRVGVSS